MEPYIKLSNNIILGSLKFAYNKIKFKKIEIKLNFQKVNKKFQNLENYKIA